jgi:phage baseplate assembly protein W
MIDAEDGSSFTEARSFRAGFLPPFRSIDGPSSSEIGSSPSPQGPWRVAERARLVLEIVPGERRREPAFGCRVHLLPEIETEEDRQLAAALIEESLEMWLPSLGVERARVDASEDGVIGLQLRQGGAWHPLSIAHRRGIRRRSP